MKTSELVNNYIDFKRSLGMRYHSEGYILRAFVRKVGDIEVKDVTPEAVRTFIDGKGPVTETWQKKFSALRGLYRFAANRGFADGDPLPKLVPKLPPARVPYIYTVPELRKLVAASETLAIARCPSRGETFRMLLILLYGCALRISEALALTLKDVNLRERLITVRETKFYKSRCIPIGPHLAEELRIYIEHRSRRPLPNSNDSHLFASENGHRWSYAHIGALFRQLRRDAGIGRDRSLGCLGSAPRLHDIRHTSAVHRVVHWYKTGENVQRLLPSLSTFLGHISIASTQRYLTMTPELLRYAGQRFEAYAWGESR